MAQKFMGNGVSYSSLSRAQLTVEYLHTNSTTHEFLFGALAELVDNARDAGATKMDIYTVPNTSVLGKFLLCFGDDGEGMDPTEVSNVIQFGRSTKRVMDSKMVGQYGNGLKSGSMRISKDMILFTKKHGTMSCLFLSRTFHEREGIHEVVVPIPSWDAHTKKPFAKSKRELEKHLVELQLILKYSPFCTEPELFEFFDRINGKGTLVVLYNMKLLDSGETELEPSDDDIKMRELYEDQADDKSVMPERKSFRAYSSILYLDPRMKIYIQGKKVVTRRMGDSLYKPKCYYFTSKRFKTRSEHEASKAMVDAKSAADKARELESVVKDMQEQNQSISKESRVKLRQVQDSAINARTEADMKHKIATAKQKSLKEPKTLTFTFGFNINRRHSYGFFIYNCNRLIKMYEKGGFQSDGRRAYAGVVGFVDVPYLVLEPTHNKQDFADAKEYKHLLRSMGDHLSQYWRDSGMKENNVDKFWENFGYFSNDIEEEPSNEPKYVRKRAMQLPFSVQCVGCLKWRVLPFSAKNIGKSVDDEWICSHSTDPERNKCSAPEQKSSIPVGILQKQVKTTEEKQKEIMEDIKKKQEKLGLLNGRGKRNHLVEENQEERPVKRVPPRSVSPLETEEGPASKASRKPSPKRSKPTAKLVCEVQPKRKRSEVTSQDIQESEECHSDSSDTVKSDETSGVSKLSKYKVNCRVDVNLSSRWYSGKVVAVKHRKNAPAKVKVKFDHYKKDKYDKWLDETDVSLKLLNEDYVVTSDSNVSSPTSNVPTSTTVLDSPPPVECQEVTVTNTSFFTQEKALEESIRVLDQMLRACISYMLVPDFPTTGEEVKQMSLEDLKQFPLDNLFVVHSNSIKKIMNDKSKDLMCEEVESTRRELAEKEMELQKTKNSEKEGKAKLSNLRRAAAKLIRSLNENPDESSVALNDDTERVDVLLEAIAEQASTSDSS